MNRDICLKKWAACVLNRDRYCQCCGATGELDPHHLFGRVNWHVAFDVRFGVGVCRACHDVWHGPENSDAWERFLGRLRLCDESRALLIETTRETPPKMLPAPDWMDVGRWLDDQRKEIENQVRWNDDCEPIYGKTII
jgi:hypothetical protein